MNEERREPQTFARLAMLAETHISPPTKAFRIPKPTLKHRFRGLICKVLGHRWRWQTYGTFNLVTGEPMSESRCCDRCYEWEPVPDEPSTP